jgi:hypothetical protein
VVGVWPPTPGEDGAGVAEGLAAAAEADGRTTRLVRRGEPVAADGDLAGLRDQFDFVVLDAPPLFPGAASDPDASQVDAALLSARAGGASTDELVGAASALRGLGVEPAGLVVADVPPSAMPDAAAHRPRGILGRLAGSVRAAAAWRPRMSAPRSLPSVLAWAVALAAVGAWAVLTVGISFGYIDRWASALDALKYGAPILALAAVLVARPHSPPQAKFALVATASVSGGLEALGMLGDQPAYAFAPLVFVLATAAALRWPLPVILAAFFVSGTFHTIDVYTPIETGPLADLALGGAWIGLLFAWVSGRSRPGPGAGPAAVLLGVYLLATFLAALAAEDLERSLYSFRSSAWLMTAVLLVPFLVRERGDRRLLLRGALLVGAVVGAYALLRWGIGHSSKEKAPLLEGSLYVRDDLGEVRLFGSLPSPQALSVWCSAMLPFGLAAALSPIGAAWRLVAVFVAGSCGAALFGADVRFGMVAAAAGAAAVVALFALARGFAGRRAVPLAVVAVLAAAGAGVFVTTKLEAEGSSGERFRNLITDPVGDLSVQERIIKWETLLADSADSLFGQGLGASGAAEKKYARFTSAATFDPDSSYVKVAYDQGVIIALLFGAAVLSLLLGLAFRALEAPDPLTAGLALGGCGALAAFAVAMAGGVYFEGLLALGPWMLVGIGFAAAPAAREAPA